MIKVQRVAGVETIERQGWLKSHKWLLLRRLSQFGVLFLFLLGPWFDLWTVRGNLTSSLTLDILPLTDPYVLLQSLAAGYWPIKTALIGAAIVLAFYVVIGGRSYCAWVCPVNVVTDTAGWLRRRIGIKGQGAAISKSTRYWFLAGTLIVAFATGSIVWELVNPVSMLHRGIIFGMGAGWFFVIAIFLFDLFISKHGWCGRLCPVGAFYSLLGKFSQTRITAAQREKCDDCMDCFIVCPEPQVIPPALKGAKKGLSPVVFDSNCINCGRCIDVCAQNVFQFSSRYSKKGEAHVVSLASPSVEKSKESSL